MLSGRQREDNSHLDTCFPVAKQAQEILTNAGIQKNFKERLYEHSPSESYQKCRTKTELVICCEHGSQIVTFVCWFGVKNMWTPTFILKYFPYPSLTVNILLMMLWNARTFTYKLSFSVSLSLFIFLNYVKWWGNVSFWTYIFGIFYTTKWAPRAEKYLTINLNKSRIFWISWPRFVKIIPFWVHKL